MVAGDERRASIAPPVARVLLWIQGAYFLATGVWPLVSVRTFQMITGPKTDHFPSGREVDHWLVMTAGTLIVAIALSLLLAAWRDRCPGEVVLLAMASSFGLICIDIIYVSRGVIWPVYLADAGIELILLVAWGVALLTRHRHSA